MPPDPIALWLLSLGIDPVAVVFGFVFGSLTLVGILIARMAANK